MDKLCIQCGGASYNQPCNPGDGISPHWYSLEDELRDSLSALGGRIAVLEEGGRPHYQPPTIAKKKPQKGGTPLG